MAAAAGGVGDAAGDAAEDAAAEEEEEEEANLRSDCEYVHSFRLSVRFLYAI